MKVNMSKRILLGLALVLVVCSPSPAGTMKVAWDPVPGAAGYNIYYGTASNSYSGVVDVGNTTQATITIGDCADYYVAAKAYNNAGESNLFSNEVSGWAKPVVNPAATINVRQGDQLTLDIDGANFQSGASLQFNTTSIPTDQSGRVLVRMGNPAILSCNRAQALLTVDPTGPGSRAMEVGSFNVGFRVTNPDGIFGAASPSLVVAYDPARSDLNQSDAATRDRVDGKDLAWLAYAHGSGEGDPRWSADADLNGDGQVDGLDLSLLAVAFGQCWTGSNWSGAACP